MKIQNVIKDGKFFVKEETYVIVKSRKMPTEESTFAYINDGNEITAIVEQWKENHMLYAKDCIDIDRDWKIITFDMELPFELVGFISTVSKALADAGISIFVISAFSTDHVLIKSDDLDKTIGILEKLGFTKISIEDKSN